MARTEHNNNNNRITTRPGLVITAPTAMSGNSNKKSGEGGGKTPSRGGISNKRPGVNSGSKGRRKKTKPSDSTTGRSTRTRSVDDDANTVSTVPTALQDFNKSSRKENKEKEGLDKNSRKIRQQGSDGTGTGGITETTANNSKNSSNNKRRESSIYKDDSDYSSKTSS